MQRNLDHSARYARNISSTWLLTLAGITFFNLVLVFLWFSAAQALSGALSSAFALAFGLLWAALGVVMLYRYRWIVDADAAEVSWICRPWVVVAAFLAAVVLSVYTWFSVGLLVACAVPIAQTLVMLRWPSSLRARLTMVVTLVLLGLAFWDYRQNLGGPALEAPNSFVLLLAYATIIPAFTVFSLWWWDIVVELDEARVAEGELAATRERLRLANDIHDLQGHHLQVVALQLELAERMLGMDPAAGVSHVQEARKTVATAQAETRSLAQQMRPVNLKHEIENAAELLRASGAKVSVNIASDVAAAPGTVLGPVIRETTTNVLRHGGNKNVSIELIRHGNTWRYAMINDVPPQLANAERLANTERLPNTLGSEGSGSGLLSIKQRVAECGGVVNVASDSAQHAVTVTLPNQKDLNS